MTGLRPRLGVIRYHGHIASETTILEPGGMRFQSLGDQPNSSRSTAADLGETGSSGIEVRAYLQGLVG
jgi:hypothetical protein